MENKDLFLTASRTALRFETNRGLISTEELWQLSLTSLDGLAKGVNRKLKDSQEESFIVKKSNADEVLELKLEILKAIIKIKQEEETAKLEERKKKQEIALLEELIAEKEVEGVKNLPVEKLRERLEALKA